MKYVNVSIKELMKVTRTKEIRVFNKHIDGRGEYYTFDLDKELFCTVSKMNRGTYYLLVGSVSANMFSQDFARNVFEAVKKEYERGEKNEN